MSYLDILNMKYKYSFKIIILSTLFILFIIYLLNLDIYNTYQIKGYVIDNLVYFKLPIEYPDVINNLEYIKINEEKGNYEIKNISAVMFDEDNLVNYQLISIDTKKEEKEENIVNICIYYNKEKVYKKLQRLLF